MRGGDKPKINTFFQYLLEKMAIRLVCKDVGNFPKSRDFVVIFQDCRQIEHQFIKCFMFLLQKSFNVFFYKYHVISFGFTDQLVKSSIIKHSKTSFYIHLVRFSLFFLWKLIVIHNSVESDGTEIQMLLIPLANQLQEKARTEKIIMMMPDSIPIGDDFNFNSLFL